MSHLFVFSHFVKVKNVLRDVLTFPQTSCSRRKSRAEEAGRTLCETLGIEARR